MGLRPALGTQSCSRASVPSLLPFVAGRQILAAGGPGKGPANDQALPQSGTIPRAAAFAQVMRATRDKLPSLASSQPAGAQAPGAAQGNDVSRPKPGRHGRREIGRALEAMYEDVVNQGVPPRIRELLDGLDARAGSSREAPSG